MEVFRKIISLILALITIPLLIMAACNLALEAAVFSRATYNAVLDDEILFENMLAEALPVVLTASNNQINFAGTTQTPVRIQAIVVALEEKPEIWAEVTNLLIPSNWLQSTTIQLVDVIFGIVEGDLETIEQEVNLTEIRSRFRGREARQAANLIVTEAPNCSAEQLEVLDLIISSGEGTVPICNPQDEVLQNQAINLISLWFGFVAEDFGSDTIPISQMFEIDRDTARATNLVLNLIFKQAIILFYLCPMALLSIIVILTVRSLNGFGRWIGSVSVAVGILMLLLAFGLQIIVFGAISEAFASSTTPAEELLARFSSALLRSILGESSTSLLLQAGISIGIGFVVLALAWYVGRNADDEGSMVLITEDGQIISTVTQGRVGSLAEENLDI